MNTKKKKLGFILILITMLFIPAMQVLFIIGYNSKYLIRLPFFIIIGILLVLSVILLIYGIRIFIQNKKSNKRRLKKWIKIVFSIFMSFYIVGCVFFVVLLYGPNEKFKNWLITTAMSTMNHQYLCKWFYNNETINDVMSKNYVKEPDESTDPELLKKKKQESYNEYEKELLIHNDDELYKVVTFDVNGAKAYIAAIFDPSKVKLAVTEQIGVIGEYVTEMMRKNNALLAINAGGFVDVGNNLGESPTGITIVDNKVVTNNEYGLAPSNGGIVGFTEDNILVLLKNTTADKAIQMGVRDAISWGPFLIVNGTPAQVYGNGGYGGGARSAIGQRKDGTVLLLVVDSNSSRTSGAGMEDLVEIMQRYGAFNASNLDGGTSSVMDFRRDIAINSFGADCHDYFSKYACHINDPIDALGIHQTRYIADAWIVVE